MQAHLKMMQVLKAQAGGFYGVGCLKIDMYNYQRDMREATKAIDVQFLTGNFTKDKQRKKQESKSCSIIF